MIYYNIIQISNIHCNHCGFPPKVLEYFVFKKHVYIFIINNTRLVNVEEILRCSICQYKIYSEDIYFWEK